MAATVSAPRPARRRLNATEIAGRIPLGLLMLLAGFLLLWPIVMLLVGIFRTEPPGQGGTWTLHELGDAFGAAKTYTALGNSLLFTLSTTLLATLIGACFAFVATRTTVPLRQLITPVMLLVLALPTLLYAVSWDILANPEVGMLNKPFKAVFDVAPLKAESWGGIIFVQALKLSSFCYFMLLAPFATMNRSYEEASLVCGASRLRTLFRIDLPVVAPAIFGVISICSVFGLGAFDIPQILGNPAGIEMLSTQIYQFITGVTPPRYAAASAYALFMILALLIFVAVQWRFSRGRSFVTVTGKSYSLTRWDLGKARWIVTFLILLFTALALVLPGIQVFLTSLQPVLGVNKNLSFHNFTAVLDDPRTAGAFRLTVYLAVGAGFAAMAIAMLLGYIGRRSGRFVERYFQLTMLAPIVVPGVVLAVGLLWAYITLPVAQDLYGTVWLTVIGLVVVVMPIAASAAASALQQIGKELEEAAQTSGASASRVLRQIVVPLASKSFLAGWLVCGVIIAGVLDVPLLLLPGGSPNVSTMVYGLLYSSALPTQASAMLVLLMGVIAAFGIAYVVFTQVVVRIVRLSAVRRR